MVRRMRWTCSLSSSWETSPLSTAFLERVAEEILAGLLLVEAGMRGFGGRVRSAPVGKHEALEMKILFQHVGEQVAVFAGIVAIHAVVGAHKGAGIGDLSAISKARRSVSRIERLSMLALTALRPLS